jgi:hypothetical protein
MPEGLSAPNRTMLSTWTYVTEEHHSERVRVNLLKSQSN